MPRAEHTQASLGRWSFSKVNEFATVPSVAVREQRSSDLKLTRHIGQYQRWGISRVGQKSAQPAQRRQLQREPEPVRGSPVFGDQLRSASSREKTRSSSWREGSPPQRPYAAASASGKNSTGTPVR
jgi:hypothetical protein